MSRSCGTLFGVGVGPGDPELVTLKAAAVLRRAHVVSYFRKRGASGCALTAAQPHLPPGVREIPFEYPVTTEIAFTDRAYVDAIGTFYATVAESLKALLREGEDVALLCEGDPFFYGSFVHMYERLRGAVPVVVIPGVTGMSACWTAASEPIALGDDVLAVLPGTLPVDALVAGLKAADAAVVMKIGGNLPKIRTALAAAGRYDDAIYVERGAMSGERIAPLSQAKDAAPYFSLILVPGCRGRCIR